MSGSPLTVPPPRDDDHDDVAWALRAASAQWRRNAVKDAVGWVRRAAETAEEIGASARAAELLQLAIALAGGPVAVAPPPPRAAMATMGIDIEFEMEEADLDEFDEVDDVEDLEDVEDVEDVEDASDARDDVDDLDDLDDVEEVEDLDTAGVDEVDDLDAAGVEEVTDDDDIVFDEVDSDDAASSVRSEGIDARPFASQFGASPARIPLARRAPSPAAPIVVEKPRSDTSSRRRSQTSPTVDMPPSMRPNPSGIDLADEIEEEEPDQYGELNFEDEHPTNRVSISDGPPAPDLGEVRMDAPSAIPLARETAAEYATSRGPVVQHDHDQIEQELGIDLSVRFSGSPKSAPIPDLPSLASRGSSKEGESFRLGEPHASFGQSRANEAPLPSVTAPPGAYDDPFGSAVSPVPGRASVRPSRPPGSPDRETSADHEPYGLAPSAQLPKTAPRSDHGRPIEPPSRPTTAPPPAAMREPEEDPARLPAVRPTGYPSGHPSAPPAAPAISNAPEPDDVDDMFAAISRPPPRPSAVTSTQSVVAPVAPAPPLVDTSPDSSVPASHLVKQTEEGGILVDGIDLTGIPGLQDLPDDAALALARTARLVSLQKGEEVSSFGVALVTRGAVQLMPTTADAPCAHARKGEVLFTKGTLPAEVSVRAVGYDPGSRVAVFSKEALEEATSSSPWVADELAEVADKYLAFAGAVLGPLGTSLDDMFRFMVLEKCTVKSKAPGAIIGQAGAIMDGMYILGGGTLELLNVDGSVAGVLRRGDFVFPETVLSASPARQTVVVGKEGALVLFANRMAAHELLATCPPFIELLAR